MILSRFSAVHTTLPLPGEAESPKVTVPDAFGRNAPEAGEHHVRRDRVRVGAAGRTAPDVDPTAHGSFGLSTAR